jgi:hypothetical protein
MLDHPISVKIPESEMSFASAKDAADEKAREIGNDPMLLAWYEGRTGRYSPDVECCGEDKPAWMVYAESRGADITIDVNEQAYVFLYADV